MKFGARNQLTGKVKDIKKGMLMCQVKIELDPKGVMSSVFTLDSLKELGIKTALWMVASITVTAFVVGGLVNFILRM